MNRTLEQVASTLSSAPITCPQCRYTEDIRMKPVTYDCMECGYTWEATKATPQEEIEFAGVRKLMYWTSKMTHGLLSSGKSEEDIIEQIEKKLDGMSTQEKTFKTILL